MCFRTRTAGGNERHASTVAIPGNELLCLPSQPFPPFPTPFLRCVSQATQRTLTLLGKPCSTIHAQKSKLRIAILRSATKYSKTLHHVRNVTYRTHGRRQVQLCPYRTARQSPVIHYRDVYGRVSGRHNTVVHTQQWHGTLLFQLSHSTKPCTVFPVIQLRIRQ